MRSRAFAPPGYVIGIVWVALFGLMGAARSEALKTSLRGGAAHHAADLPLPRLPVLYRRAAGRPPPGLSASVLTEAYTVYCAITLRRAAPKAAALLVPLILWLAFAFVLVIAVFRLNS